ncbi:MAG TPA: DUF885 domain-containing protein [Usitatibacter sp.]|nr:DUF885 domain-containing protein [Usitatibacter sp.]
MRALVLTVALLAASASAATPDWIARSNAIVQPVLELRAKFTPEQASFRGLEQYDTEVADLKPKRRERELAALDSEVASLKRTREGEQDARVRQDIDIVVGALERDIANERIESRHLFAYYEPAKVVDGGLSILLDPRNKPERQARALVRLQRYAGSEPGYVPIAVLARQRIEEDMARPGLVGPYVDEVKQDIANTDLLLKGIADLFAKDGITGWEKDFELLSAQLRGFRKFQQEVILPRARPSLLLPREVYAARVRLRGVDLTPEEVMERAGSEWQEVSQELDQLAAQVAQAHGFASSRARDVIAELKKQQLAPDAMLALYRERLRAIEAIIRRERIITLPQRDMTIRLSTPAEAASTPAPNLRPPRFIGNTGEYGEFLIPLANPHAKSGAAMDDFSFDAATWIVTAHEARPGHELQFARMVEEGVSLARGTFAFNSANTEGWGLYCETLILPYMPPEGKLVAMQFRLLRLARATLDPLLNLGRITPERAKQVLMEDVGVSEPFAQQEVDRYTFWAPGQATSYFYGLQKLRAIRTQAEIALGPRFDLQKFHDFIISQGMLPPDLLERAVMEQLVPSALAP